MKLTQRDRVMLTVLVIALLIFCGAWFIIRPAWKEVQASKKEYNDLRSTYQAKQQEVEQKAHVRDEVATITKECNDLRERFYEDESAINISHEVKQQMDEDKIEITSLSFSQSSKQLAPYSYTSSAGVDTPFDDYANLGIGDDASQQAGSNSAAIPTQSIGCYTFSIQFKGATRDQIFSYIDKLKTLEYNTLVVTSLSFNVSEATSKEGCDGSLSLELYYMTPLQMPSLDEIDKMIEAGTFSMSSNTAS